MGQVREAALGKGSIPCHLNITGTHYISFRAHRLGNHIFRCLWGNLKIVVITKILEMLQPNPLPLLVFVFNLDDAQGHETNLPYPARCVNAPVCTMIEIVLCSLPPSLHLWRKRKKTQSISLLCSSGLSYSGLWGERTDLVQQAELPKRKLLSRVEYEIMTNRSNKLLRHLHRHKVSFQAILNAVLRKSMLHLQLCRLTNFVRHLLAIIKWMEILSCFSN